MIKIRGKKEDKIIESVKEISSEIHFTEMTYTEDKESFGPDDEKILMIQFVGMSQNGPIILTRLFRGKSEIDAEIIKERLRESKSKIISANKKNEVMEELELTSEIISEDYGYVTVPIYGILRFT